MFPVTNSTPTVRTDAVTPDGLPSLSTTVRVQVLFLWCVDPRRSDEVSVCLSNHVEPLDVDDDAADEISLLHVVHLVVPAASHYAAIAKGTTAASFVPRNDRTITSCDLVADLDDEPAKQLVKR